MSILEVLAYGVLALMGLYLAARLVSAAYFKSKQQHETQRKNHG